MNPQEKQSQKKELITRILDSWIGKMLSSIVYHLLWRIFIKKEAKQ